MKKGIAVVFFAILCTFLFYGIRYMNSPISTQKATYSVYENSVDTSCYFARRETVYASETSGTVYNSYSDGMRVRKGALISTVYSGNVSEEVLQVLSTIDKKIENVKSTSVMNADSTVPDDSNLENRIDTYKYDIISAAIKNDVDAIKRYKEAINSLRNGTSNMTNEDIITDLEYEKTQTEARIGGGKQEIYTEDSGVFSTVLDGMEHILTPENMMDITVRDYDGIIVPKEKTANKSVNVGDSICKIVNNHQWYVITTLAAERLDEIEINDNITMRFDSIPGIDVAGKVISISDKQDGKCVVVIESSQYVESAYSMRQSDMEIIFDSYSGYKIPIYAIRNQDGVQGVIAKKNNVENFYPCEILYTNKEAEYVIINSPADAQKTLEDVDEFVIGER